MQSKLIMRKFFYLILLPLLPLFAQAQVERPLYYVDGVPNDSLPPRETIERVTVVSAEEAVPIYGERASGGVILITTKEYAQKQQSAQSSSKKHHLSLRFGSGSATKVRGIVMALTLGFMMFIGLIQKLLSKALRHKKKKPSIPIIRSYDSFDPEGERFEASANWANYMMPIMSVAVIIFMGVVLYRMATGIVPSSNGNFVLGCIFTAVVDVFCIIVFIRRCKNMKSYLVVDEKGIRCVYNQKKHTLYTKSGAKEVNITWEEIKRAEIEGNTVFFYKKGTRIPDDMEDFAELADLDMDEEEFEASVKELDLSLFPVHKVKDCINYFYDRYNTAQASKRKKPLIVPSDEANSLIVWITIIGLLAIDFFTIFKIT